MVLGLVNLYVTSLPFQGFLDDDTNVFVDPVKNKVTLTMILKWYQIDFGTNSKEVLEFITRYISNVSYQVNFSM